MTLRELKPSSYSAINVTVPDVARQLIEIGEKGMKQREKGERAKHVARPREARACKHVACKEKQLKLQLQLK